MIIGKQLEVFLAVAEAQSFSGATKMLSIGQSVVSHHIESLERELGVALFERRGKSIKLTEEGLLLFEKGKRLHQDSLRIQEMISRKSRSPESRCRETPTCYVDDQRIQKPSLSSSSSSLKKICSKKAGHISKPQREHNRSILDHLNPDT